MPELTPDQKYIAELSDAIEKIWEIARREGLDPFPVNFELVPATIMYEFGSYGLPGRFSHWSRGKAYYRMKTEYDYGLSKIYELVVNTNPSYAFLMEQNDLLQNKVVVAHVLGHTDMFKNNVYFKHTSRNMIDKVSVNAERIRKYEYEHGTDEVERFLDAVLAIEEHIDPNVRIKAARESEDAEPSGKRDRESRHESPYDDLWRLAEHKGAEDAEDEEARSRLKPRRSPPEQVKDLLLFLASHAPNLEEWQRDVLLIVREEMLYLVPQMQTKILNEGWACLVGDSLVLTEHGLLRFDALHAQLAAGDTVAVASGGGALDPITDRHVRRAAPTIRLRTRRGFVLEGAEEHKLSIGPDQWLALHQVRVGQRIPLRAGEQLWARELVPLAVATAHHAAVEKVLVGAGATARTDSRAWATGDEQDIPGGAPAPGGDQARAAMPAHITPELAEWLGFLFSRGALPSASGAIGVVFGERALADRYAALVHSLFGLHVSISRGAPKPTDAGEHWRADFFSEDVCDLLASLGVEVQAPAATLCVPAAILRSPKEVVSAFLRAAIDCDATVSAQTGVTLHARSEDAARTLQVVLLNFGILTQRQGARLDLRGQSAAVFAREIDCAVASKRDALRLHCERAATQSPDDPTDEVVSVERGVADVYDITVDRSHCYVAGGMVHHNSFWHARIMRELDLSDGDHTAFAQMHAGVLAPSRMRLNPYHLGYKMLEDIERRWDNPTEEQRAKGWLPGKGREKIFEVREIESDLSLLRNYLTKELVQDLDLYLYRKEDDEWVIAEKNWEKVRDGIIASMTNFGYPYITVLDADYNRNTELYLKHHFEGQELDQVYAQKTLEYVQYIWSRPVHLETVVDEEHVLLSYDGTRHARVTIETED